MVGFLSSLFRLRLIAAVGISIIYEDDEKNVIVISVATSSLAVCRITSL